MRLGREIRLMPKFEIKEQITTSSLRQFQPSLNRSTGSTAGTCPQAKRFHSQIVLILKTKGREKSRNGNQTILFFEKITL